MTMSKDSKSVTAAEIEKIMTDERNDAQRDILMRFFKTGKGEYGEGDRFLGLKVPQTRAIVKEARLLVPLGEIETLLRSQWHEVRLAGLLLLVEEMNANLPKRRDTADVIAAKARRREEIARFYIDHAACANNWDLVDLSCPKILGPYLRLADSENSGLLMQLARSNNLWEQRIAIVTTLDFIQNGIFSPTLALADNLIDHRHDLIHKAIGWMLREIGKRDIDTLTAYLEQNYHRLPRTSLRYAIERFPAPLRHSWLTRR